MGTEGSIKSAARRCHRRLAARQAAPATRWKFLSLADDDCCGSFARFRCSRKRWIEEEEDQHDNRGKHTHLLLISHSPVRLKRNRDRQEGKRRKRRAEVGAKNLLRLHIRCVLRRRTLSEVDLVNDTKFLRVPPTRKYSK